MFVVPINKLVGMCIICLKLSIVNAMYIKVSFHYQL